VNEDRSNGLTITAEFSTGSGIADLYTGMTGGLLFPTLANDQGLLPPPPYVPNMVALLLLMVYPCPLINGGGQRERSHI
jgi:hypothetical protein